MDRNKLDTCIEKEVHKLVFEISEHVYDYVHIYAMRNKWNVDKELMENILRIVKTAIQDGYGSRITNFHKGVSKVLDEYTETESSLAANPKATPK